MSNVEEIDILGVRFNKAGNGKSHAENRISKCRKAYFGNSENGLCYPGLSSAVKVYLWRTCCAPVLTYGCDVLYFNKGDIGNFETLQGNLIKHGNELH